MPEYGIAQPSVYSHWCKKVGMGSGLLTIGWCIGGNGLRVALTGSVHRISAFQCRAGDLFFCYFVVYQSVAHVIKSESVKFGDYHFPNGDNYYL